MNRRSLTTSEGGNLTLTDSPGFSDSNLERTDRKILNELVTFIRPGLFDKLKGITAFV